MIDLHTHTNESDGSLSPAELVARAAAMGLEALAICEGLGQKYKVEHVLTGLADHPQLSFYRP
ncbi:MAG: PHP domain-containing protein, partial [Alicyclobacillus herbarius]|uniref:PHP domain-containing protein n=1 Tax=Alicyclobacillus herbarius TaxID=122960 RepID=UPI002354C416